MLRDFRIILVFVMLALLAAFYAKSLWPNHRYFSNEERTHCPPDACPGSACLCVLGAGDVWYLDGTLGDEEF